jgi:hypothetical protein
MIFDSQELTILAFIGSGLLISWWLSFKNLRAYRKVPHLENLLKKFHVETCKSEEALQKLQKTCQLQVEQCTAKEESMHALLTDYSLFIEKGEALLLKLESAIKEARTEIRTREEEETWASPKVHSIRDAQSVMRQHLRSHFDS